MASSCRQGVDWQHLKTRWLFLAGLVATLCQLGGAQRALALPVTQVNNYLPADIRTTIISSPKSKRINLDGYQIDRAVVKYGQTLSTILEPYGFSVPKIYKLGESARGVFNFRSIQAGKLYWVVRDDEPPYSVKYFIYEKSAVDFIVLELGSLPKIFTFRKPLYKETRRVSGTITHSLWNTMKAHGANTDLIPKLQEVLGNKINFQKLKPKDQFFIIYEEYSDGSIVVQVGNIIAVKLTSIGKQIAGFRYSHCGIAGYYDESGNNMQTAFLHSPIQGGNVTSEYSDNRKHPITKRYRRHPAIDYGAPSGTPVMSVGDGVIRKISYSSTAGNFIKIDHLYSYSSQYMHLNSIAHRIEIGSRVNKGDTIGFVGSTGLATGPHLDFRFSEHGRLVDYATVKLPDGQKVDMKCRADFDLKVQHLVSKLTVNNSKTDKT